MLGSGRPQLAGPGPINIHSDLALWERRPKMQDGVLGAVASGKALWKKQQAGRPWKRRRLRLGLLGTRAGGAENCRGEGPCSGS